jgi:hypothetical protein
VHSKPFSPRFAMIAMLPSLLLTACGSAPPRTSTPPAAAPRPAIPPLSASAQAAAALADALGRSAAIARRAAADADDARARGLKCEADYDALTLKPTGPQGD